MDTLTIALSLLLMVESQDNPKARGDYDAYHGYRAVGCLQMWKITVDDANRIRGTLAFTYEDRKSRQKSILMARIVLSHYGNPRRLGHKPTIEDYVRMWKSGPRGYAMVSTRQQWHKAREVLIAGTYRPSLWRILACAQPEERKRFKLRT